MSTVECCYNTVQFIMILHVTLRWQNVNQILISKQTLYTSHSQASYGVSIVRIWEKTDHIITAPHCILEEICCAVLQKVATILDDTMKYHWSRNNNISMWLSLLAVTNFAILQNFATSCNKTASSAPSDENLIKMIKFPFHNISISSNAMQ